MLTNVRYCTRVRDLCDFEQHVLCVTLISAKPWIGHAVSPEQLSQNSNPRLCRPFGTVVTRHNQSTRHICMEGYIGKAKQVLDLGPSLQVFLFCRPSIELAPAIVLAIET